MDRKYWEKIAPGYNDEIFDVLKNDRKSIIRKAIKRVASANKTVMDIGCAVGKWLPLLSPQFGKVVAVDISAKNLEIARKTHEDLTNIDYVRADMSGKTKLPACDVAICINAILTDSAKKRASFFDKLPRCLKKGGSLVLVLPSLESWMLTRIVQQQWKIDSSLFRDKITSKEGLKKYQRLLQGNAEIDDVPTKHYLREELELLLSREGLVMQQAEKIEYEWTTEFVKPPSWLQRPGPWDWMVVAKKS